MPGTVLSSLYSLSYLTDTCKKKKKEQKKTSMKYYDPVLQIGEMKLREVGKLAHGQTASYLKR